MIPRFIREYADYTINNARENVELYSRIEDTCGYYPIFISHYVENVLFQRQRGLITIDETILAIANAKNAYNENVNEILKFVKKGAE